MFSLASFLMRSNRAETPHFIDFLTSVPLILLLVKNKKNR